MSMMRLPVFEQFCDVTVTSLVWLMLVVAAYSFGTVSAQTKVKEDCDGLNMVMLAGDRYECVNVSGVKT